MILAEYLVGYKIRFVFVLMMVIVKVIIISMLTDQNISLLWL